MDIRVIRLSVCINYLKMSLGRCYANLWSKETELLFLATYIQIPISELSQTNQRLIS